VARGGPHSFGSLPAGRQGGAKVQVSALIIELAEADPRCSGRLNSNVGKFFRLESQVGSQINATVSRP